MHQRRRLQRLPGQFARHFGGGELAQFRINQRQQLCGRLRAALPRCFEDLGDLGIHYVGCASTRREPQGVWRRIFSLLRTAASTSDGSTPMAPLITESFSVTSLSARMTDAALSPVCRQPG